LLNKRFQIPGMTPAWAPVRALALHYLKR
jgi:hypothetical protein